MVSVEICVCMSPHACTVCVTLSVLIFQLCSNVTKTVGNITALLR